MVDIKLDSQKNLLVKNGDFSSTITAGMQTSKTRESVEAMKALVAEVEANPQNLSKEVRDALKQVPTELKALGASPAKIDLIHNAMNYAPVQGATAEHVTADLIKNPLARKFLDDNAIIRHGIDDPKKLDALIEARGKLIELAKAEKFDAEAATKLLNQHASEPRSVFNALAGGSGKLKDVSTKLIGSIESDRAKLTPMLEKLRDVEAKLNDAEAAGTKTAGLQKQKDNVLKNITELTNTDKNAHASHVLNGLNKSDTALVESARAADKSLDSHFTSVMESGKNASKNDGKGFFTKAGNWFMHDAEKLGEIAKKQNKAAVGELGFFSRLNKGKAALVGAGVVVTGAVLANVGKKPGPAVEAEMARRQQGQEAAVGVA